jgi:hypothetical protein
MERFFSQHSKVRGFILIALCVVWILSSSQNIHAQQAVKEAADIQVDYYGEQIGFGELLSRSQKLGRKLSCASELTENQIKRGAFDPKVDRVQCFDTDAEADKITQKSIALRKKIASHSGLGFSTFNHGGSKLISNHQQNGCDGPRISLYKNVGYTGPFKENFCWSLPYINVGIYSVWDDNNGCYKLWDRFDYDGNYWQLCSTIWSLGGWGGNVKSLTWIG